MDISDPSGRPEPSRDGAPLPKRQGPSSYGMHDAGLVFEFLGLQPGHVFLDAGCGPGDYAFRAAQIVGPKGKVFALDVWQRMIDAVREEAAHRGLDHLETKKTDITRALPLDDKCVDVCLVATVLHILDPESQGAPLFRELHRVLRSTGRLAVINCKKEDQPFGPPLIKRWSPEQTAAIALPAGFTRSGYLDLGYNYLVLFSA